MSAATTPLWSRIVDDAAIFPPGNAALDDAIAAHLQRPPWPAGLVGSLVVRDTDLPHVRELGGAVSVVVTGGAGQLAGPVEYARRHGIDLKGIEVALRDDADLPGNARRVVAALDAIGALDDTVVYVELPAVPPSAGWLAAADEVAAAEHRLKFRTGGLTPDAFPEVTTLAHWIDASLDRETPFKCTAGLHRAVRGADPGHHGFLNILLATAAAWDGAPRAQVERMLAETDPKVLTDAAQELGDDLVRARRWFTSFGSCSVDEPAQDLLDLGLVER